mmetsp:Transcript_13090/g.19605  ORF Transcript_13090/g.19605 Transcript_13090/m.19605 type:complete len:1676 (-) Transcript_13090:3005-8032(-)
MASVSRHQRCTVRDPRYQFFLTQLEGLFGIPATKASLTDLQPLERFVDDASCSIVIASHTKPNHEDGTETLVFSNECAELLGRLHSAEATTVLFLKLSQCILENNEMVKSLVTLFVIPKGLAANVLSVFGASVKSVFAPVLLGTVGADVDSTANIPLLSEKAKGLLFELERSISASPARGDVTLGCSADFNEFSYIYTPLDELQFWEDFRGGTIDPVSAEICRKNMRDIVEAFHVNTAAEVSGRLSIEDQVSLDLSLTSTFGKLDASFGEGGVIERALFNIYHVNLRDAEPVYSIERMTNTIGILSSAFCQLIRQSLPAHPGLFVGHFSLVQSFLRAAIQLVESFYAMIKKLTNIDFRACREYPWRGPTHRNLFLENFLARLQDILDIRTTYEEMRILSGQIICDELTNFKPFMLYDPLLWSPYTGERFESSRKSFNASLVPLERSVIVEIKRRIEPLMNHGAVELVKFLSRFHVLLKRPNIAGEMSAIMQKLNQSLAEVVDSMEEVIDELDDGENHVHGITLCRQCGHKARQIESYAAGLNLDPDVIALYGVLDSKCKGTEQTIFKRWISRFELVHIPVLTGRLIEIDKNGILQVTFEESLIVLLSQARQLTELRLPIPASVKEYMTEGEKLFRFGVVLKKVTNFYNSLEDLIIPEQRAMLLDSLIAFERLIKDGYSSSSTKSKKTTSWRGVDDSELFVEKLHAEAEKLRNEINCLRTLHEKLTELSSSLSEIDLLTQKALWQKCWAEIEALINDVSKRYPQKCMSKWVHYWNKEFYRVLKSTYIGGLQIIATKLGEYKCALDIKDGIVTFNPPLSTLRSKQNSKIKSFIEFPGTKFIGFGASELFAQIPIKNSKLIDVVHKNADGLFDRVDLLRNSYYNIWSNLRNEFKEDCSGLADFEAAFCLLEKRSKEFNLIPDTKRIDCVRVSLFDFKALLTTKLQDLYETLVAHLRKSVSNLTIRVDDYLASSITTLEQTPFSVDEFKTAQTQWKVIDSEKKSMHDLSIECEKLKELLMEKGNGIVDITSNALELDDSRESIWRTLDDKLVIFSAKLEKQKGNVVNLLLEDVTKLNNRVNSFKSRWNAVKPAGIDDFCLETLRSKIEACVCVEEEFTRLNDDANDLTSQCAAFSVRGPQTDEISSISVDIEKTIKSFAFLRKYLVEREELARQYWIEFRANIFVLEEFCAKWNNCSKQLQEKEFGADFAVMVLEKDVGCMQKSMSTLKLCRGDVFREDHWSELLQGKLELSKTVRIENLTIGHFLSVLDKLCNSEVFQFVGDLQSRARGEVIIREGIQELSSWAHLTELQTTIYKSCNGRLTTLIKNWKDMLCELGNKQALLATLKESPFFKPFFDTGIIYENKFAQLDKILRILNQIQRKWLYLIPIFSRGSLKSEESRFNRVDVEFCNIMGIVEKDSKLFHFVDTNIHCDLENRCEIMLDQLNRCQRTLSAFLEQKRSAMPRFYFVGDDDLLEIIGQGSNISIMQAHFKKLFQATSHVEVDKESSTLIDAFGSQEGESVALVKKVEISNDVEDWLRLLVDGIKFSLRCLLSSCLQEDDHSTYYWDKYPGQVIGLAACVRFSKEVIIALKTANGLSTLKHKLASNLQGCHIKKSSLEALKIKGLVLDLIRYRDIVDQLLSHRITSENDWIWQKQLRYTCDERLCRVHMGLAALPCKY